MNTEIFASPLFIVPILTGPIFILTGLFMQFFPPKTINGLYGYRTTRSMQDQKHWDFAQKYSAKLMIKYGVVLCLCALLTFIDVKSEILELSLSLGILIGLVVIILIKTEKALKELSTGS